MDYHHDSRTRVQPLNAPHAQPTNRLFHPAPTRDGATTRRLGHGEGVCLQDEDVALYQEGALGAAHEAAIRSHIGRCAPCRELIGAVAAYAPDHTVQLPSPPTVRDPVPDAPVAGEAPGQVFAGKYLVDGMLGEGGMGRVLSARHVELDRPVAIKVIHSEWARDPESARRLVREARAAANLSSHHIACVYDLGRTVDGLPYIVMERLEGMDLGALIAAGPIDVEEAVGYVLQALSALMEAHARGIIHRDLKPQNLFLVTERSGKKTIKVLDFGLAKDFARMPDVNGESKLTGVHMMLGSPHFMSPEQIRDARDVDARSDIWSIGATLYQLLTGGLPFVAANTHVVCAKIISESAPPLSRHRADVPPAIESVVMRCLSRDRTQRYQSASALADALRIALSASGRRPSSRPSAAAPQHVATAAMPQAANQHPAPSTLDMTIARAPQAIHVRRTTSSIPPADPPAPFASTLVRPIPTPLGAHQPQPYIEPPVQAQPRGQTEPTLRIARDGIRKSGRWMHVLAAFGGTTLIAVIGVAAALHVRLPQARIEASTLPSGSVVAETDATSPSKITADPAGKR